MLDYNYITQGHCLFCNESLAEEIDVSFLGTKSLCCFLPIFKCNLDALDDSLGLCYVF